MRTISVTAQESAALRVSGYCGVISKGGTLEGNVSKGDKLEAREMGAEFSCTVRVVAIHTVQDDATLHILVPAI